MNHQENDKKNTLMQYAGMGAQFMTGIGIFLFIGLKTDQWLSFKNPLFVWLLPLLFILSSIIKLIIETGKKNNKNHD